MSAPAIEARGLRKSYGAVEAVRGIDLRVDHGEVFALLGPNGAGKTTTVEVLEGHRARGGGEVRVLGKDPWRAGRALKERIGIVLQSTGAEPYLTVEETVELFRGYYPKPRPLDELISLVGLEGKRRERVRRLSGGQQRRLDVAVGLAGDPELLFLDEPTTGFDPSARRNAWQMVRDLRSMGKTVFLTTHYMDEAQSLADRVAIIVGGRIVAQGQPQSLVERDAPTTISFRVPAAAGSLPPDLPGATVDGGRVTIRTPEPTKTLHELTTWALERSVELEELSVTRPSLEDVFIGLTEQTASE